MAGIYIHIPFCARRCIYCGFFSTSMADRKEQYAKSVCAELELQKDWLRGEPVSTLYLGGGTPSQLSLAQIEMITEAVSNYPGTGDIRELTIECNPDDITAEFVRGVSQLGFNRISMGVQSFDDGMLGFLRRRHNADQAIRAVRTCQENGIRNVSIDLMYGLPGQTLEMQESDVRLAISLGVSHISSYCLSYEPDSPLDRLRQAGQITPCSDETCESMFNQMCNLLDQAGYRHYEISNFCREGMKSMHNSNYWNGTPYLGIGAGAHSFDGNERRWNPDDLDLYIRCMSQGKLCFENEILSVEDKYNECLMLGLRTSDGICLDSIRKRFGEKYYNQLRRNAAPFIASGKLKEERGCLRFPLDSLFISDSIISSLFAD